MKRLEEYTFLFFYTCLNNLTSITLGCFITFLTLIWLTTFLTPSIALAYCPLVTFAAYLMSFYGCKLTEVKKSLLAKSNCLGMMVGCLYIMALFSI